MRNAIPLMISLFSLSFTPVLAEDEVACPVQTKVPGNIDKIMRSKTMAVLTERGAATAVDTLGLAQQRSAILLQATLEYDGLPRIAEFQAAVSEDKTIP